ncbi:methyltransferase domain-containing protein, partial [Candidatus Dojkabacteria bacterium]|nr:methyltransferase domain-containing protein [Candidatus Dojkabacteria bacterium]
MVGLSKKSQFFVQNIDKLNKTLHVLEIGAGKGKEATYLADLGFEVTTIDPNSNIKDSRITEIKKNFESVENSKLPIGNLIAFFSLHFIDKEKITEKLDFLIR